MKRIVLNSLAILSVIAVIFSSCDKDAPAVTVFSKTDSVVVYFSPTASYTFFRFKDSTVVANSDSATANWDFGLKFTTFILNSHAYGPGNAGAILQNSIYSSVTAAPATGYAYDTTTSQKAIKDGSWYNYNPSTHAFTPKAGQTFIFRTADDHYVKMELLSVDYEAFVGPTPVKLIYRFRYTYQGNGSLTF
ncbi:MAG: HmuY family protein [Bacteroidota bacterium]